MTTILHLAIYADGSTHIRKGKLISCQCGSAFGYCEQFDAYYCVASSNWLENKCDDQNCEYCSKRPEKFVKEAVVLSQEA